MVAVFVALALPSRAFAVCTAFSEDDLRSAVKTSTDAVAIDDTTSHRRAWLDVVDGLPCLAVQLPKDAWSELLVSEAIVRYALREDWQAPLATALQILPDIATIPSWLLGEFTQLPPPPLTTDVPRGGATLFVDGVLAPRVPDLRLAGPHVAQLLDGGHWTTVFLDNEPIPPGWVEARVAPAPAPVARWVPGPRGAMSFDVGIGNELQFVDEPGTWLGNTRYFGLLTGADTFGSQPLVSGLSLAWDLRAGFQAPSVQRTTSKELLYYGSAIFVPNAYGGVGWQAEHLAVWAGAGVTTGRATVGDTTTPYIYPQPHVAVDFLGNRTDFGFGAGYTPSATHLTFRVGTRATDGAVGLRLGGSAATVLAWYDEVAPGTRKATVVELHLAGNVGFTWGGNAR